MLSLNSDYSESCSIEKLLSWKIAQIKICSVVKLLSLRVAELKNHLFVVSWIEMLLVWSFMCLSVSYDKGSTSYPAAKKWLNPHVALWIARSVEMKNPSSPWIAFASIFILVCCFRFILNILNGNSHPNLIKPDHVFPPSRFCFIGLSSMLCTTFAALLSEWKVEKNYCSPDKSRRRKKQKKGGKKIRHYKNLLPEIFCQRLDWNLIPSWVSQHRKTTIKWPKTAIIKVKSPYAGASSAIASIDGDFRVIL